MGVPNKSATSNNRTRKTFVISFIMISIFIIGVIDNNSAAALPNQDNEYLTRNSQETDSDNDGMPDWWENHWALYAENNNLSNTFDPYNASDANEDWDEDVLSNLIEYQRMTNPYVPDLEIKNGTPLENDNKDTADLDDRDYREF